VENDFDDIEELFAARVDFLKTVSREVKKAGHELINFDVVVEISELIFGMIKNPIVRNFFLDKDAMIYFMATRRIVDRFIFDLGLEILDSDQPLKGEMAKEKDFAILIREQACVQACIDQMPRKSVDTITDFLRRSGFLVKLGAWMEGVSDFPEFEGYYDRPVDRIMFGLSIFERYDPKYAAYKAQVGFMYHILNAPTWRRYVSEFLKLNFCWVKCKQ
jgi:hypothetical protein